MPRLHHTFLLRKTRVHRTDTHWTRIFYCDLYAPQAEALTRQERKEIVMASRHSHDTDRPIGGSPLGAAMVLLGIYLAMYVAVAGVVHVLTPQEAAAADRQPAAAAAAAPSPLSNPLAKHGAGHAQTH